MIIVTFSVVLGVTLAFGIYSKRGAGKSTADFLVAGRKFGGVLLYILIVGEVYSIGTIIRFPGGIYADGPGFGIWFMGYILLGYPIGYFVLPLLWKAGRKYGAMTLPDVLKGHFGSRTLELTAALVCVLFLIPWAQLQLTGMTVALNGLGLGLTPLVTVLIGVGIALIFVVVSGIRAPAYVSFVKDFGLIFAIIVVAIFVLGQDMSVPQIMADANAHSSHVTIQGSAMLHTVSTMLFQAVGPCVFPFLIQAVFTSKTAKMVKKTQIGMPIYMLMYPFLVLAAYFAMSQFPGLEGADTNLAFIKVARQILPDWLVGVVAGSAALCAILVLAASALALSTLVTRNVIPHVKESRQKSSVRTIIVVYLAVSVVLTLAFPSIMGTLINTAYYGFSQLVVSVALLIIGSRVRPIVIAAGLFVGTVLSICIYLSGWEARGLNIGVLGLAANVLIVVLGRLMWPALSPSEPMLASRRSAAPGVTRPVPVPASTRGRTEDDGKDDSLVVNSAKTVEGETL